MNVGTCYHLSVFATGDIFGEPNSLSDQVFLLAPASLCRVAGEDEVSPWSPHTVLTADWDLFKHHSWTS